MAVPLPRNSNAVHVKRDPAQPQTPINVSDKIIFVVWDKPLGGGYRYKVTVDDGGQNHTSVIAEQGFGNVRLHDMFGLTADTYYTVSVELECKAHRATFARYKKITNYHSCLVAELCSFNNCGFV